MRGRARSRIDILLLVSVLFIIGCSKPDDARLIQAAIESSYQSIYRDLTELRTDYPGFTPRIRRWSDDLVFLFGEGLYAVQMPEEEVLVTASGVAKANRTCGSEGSECVVVPPRQLELEVVGTVQIDAPDYPAASNFEVSWKGESGSVNIVGHCFVAAKSSMTEPLELSIHVPGYDPIVMRNVFGSRLVAATASHKFNYYSSMRIPKAMFMTSKTCSKEARAEWPNVGGWAWKR